MFRMKGRAHIAAATAACSALLALGSYARAEDAPPTTQPAPVPAAEARQPSTAPGAAPQENPPAKVALLAEGLNQIGLGKPLTDAGISITGFIEGSYTRNFDPPPGDVNPGRVFDFEDNVLRLNQLELLIVRAPDVAKAAKEGRFDLGFTAEMIYGSDSRLIHSNGLSIYGSNTHPINQFDPAQMFVDLILPVGNGLDIRVGKFGTLLGYEVTNPTLNALYSHSFLFGFGVPISQSGALAIYNLNDKVTLTGGVTRGWDQSTKDNNDAVDFLGQVKYVATEELTLYVNGSVGPQRADDNSDYRYEVEGIATYTPKDSQWTYALDSVLALDENAALNGNNAYWYGAIGYVGYKINDGLTVNARGEWFRDDGGSRLGTDASFFEATLGLKVTPFAQDRVLSNLFFRPEIRWDYATKDFFDGGAKHDQWTFGIDGIFTF
jgi:hypothetical protein